MKKLLKIALISVLSATMVALPILNVNAAIDSNGCYVPSENVESTRRYYFGFPKSWYNELTDEPAVYWMGEDECYEFGIEYPGYKPQSTEHEDVYYIDCPTDIYELIWNNNISDLDFSSFEEFEKFGKLTTRIPIDFYYENDPYNNDLYTPQFFDEMKRSYQSDKKALGTYADNFFFDDTEGFSFNFDNMIFIIGGPFIETAMYTTGWGKWYFYYGNGEFGTYPLKEDAIAKGIYGKLYETGGSFSVDLDGDGYTNVKDITYLQRYCADYYSGFKMKVEVLADINNDNLLNVNDITTMQRYLAGM